MFEGAIFSVGLACGGEGANSFWAQEIARRPRRRGGSGFRRESLAPRPARRRPRRKSTAAVPARARGLQRVARPAWVEGPSHRQGQRARLAPFPSPTPTRRLGSLGLGGSRNTPLCPQPQQPGAPLSARAVRLEASSGRAPGAELFPGSWVRWGSPQARDLTLCGRRGAPDRGSGPTAWFLVAPGPQTSLSLPNRLLGWGGDGSSARGCVLRCRRAASFGWRGKRGGSRSWVLGR